MDAVEKHPTSRELYESCLSGAQDRPFIPRLRSDPPSFNPLPHSLLEFRKQEGKEERERRLHELWKRLPNSSYHGSEVAPSRTLPAREPLTAQRAEEMRKVYEDELLGKFGCHITNERPSHIRWPEFRRYAETKEAGECFILCSGYFLRRRLELWSIFHDELDLDGNGHLDKQELALALSKAGEIVMFLYSLPL